MDSSLIAGGEIPPVLQCPPLMMPPGLAAFLIRCVLLLLVGLVVSCTATKQSRNGEIPRPHASAWCLIDARSGQALASHRAEHRRPVASTQKLLTALVVAEAGDLEKTVTISAADTKVPGSVLGLKPGDTATRLDLLRALLMESSNDAALALARDHAGNTEAFAERMNARAVRVGTTRSRFVNPHGLTAYRQSSSPQDMACIAKAALAHPIINRIVGTPVRTISISGAPRELVNANELLQRLPGCTGMKTGLTPGAGICLISSYRLGQREVILVQLDSSKNHIYTDAAKLMQWGVRQAVSE